MRTASLLAIAIAMLFAGACSATPATSVPPTVTTPPATAGATAPATAATATTAPTQTPPPSTGTCSVTIEPAVAAPGGWGFIMGSGFKKGERISWTQQAEDGSLFFSIDSDSNPAFLPDARGGFGFGIGAPGPDEVGHTITGTITAESCSAEVTWRIEAENDQTRPLSPVMAESCSFDRSTLDRPDDTDEHQVHLIYAVPSDGPDLHLDTNSQIAVAFDGIDEFLRERMDGHAFRLDTCDGAVDVTYLQMPRTAAEYAGMRNGFLQGLEIDLIDKGFRYGQKLYVVVWEGLSQWARIGDGCGGEAGYHGVAVSFGRTVDGERCGRLGVEIPIAEQDRALAHEIIHLLGVPADCAGDLDETGHVTDDPADLMYGVGHTTMDVIDAEHDDYYDHDIPDCPDLADSAFLDPLPRDPVLPVGWPAD